MINNKKSVSLLIFSLSLLILFMITISINQSLANPKEPYSLGSVLYDPLLEPEQSMITDIREFMSESAETLITPLQLTAVPGDTFVDLSWRLSSDKIKVFSADDNAHLHPKIINAEDIAGFTVSYGKESKHYTITLDLGNINRYRIRNLQNHTTYFLGIKCYTKSKQFSIFSNEVSATPSPEEELMSDIEKLISGKFPSSIFTELKQFGYDLFSQKISTFAPILDVPVGPDYIIGPGDSFSIMIWGKAQANYTVKVDRNGKINLPEIGAVNVLGLTFAELKDVLKARLSDLYPEFQISITMEQLRTIQIYVVGKARAPGHYALSSLSTMINALFAAGGPSKSGTMRRIQLIRNGKLIKTLDLYDFLLKGDKSQDERLQPGDTIFIPIIGEVTGIAGNVKTPAIYEMKDKLTVEDLIELSGGVTPVGYLQRIQMERFMEHEKKIVLDLNLSPAYQKGELAQLKTILQDGDLVKVYPIIPLTQDIVYLEGHVLRPDGYELKPDMKLSDLITSYEDLLPEPHLDYAEIIRLEEPDLHEKIIPFSLVDILEKEPGQDLKLKRFDRVRIYSKRDFKDRYIVNIEGEIRHPGQYLLYENMRVKDLVEKAGGFKVSAYLNQAEITRSIISQEGVYKERIEIDLEKAMQGDLDQNLLLQKYDTITIRIIPEWRAQELVTIRGEIRFPGTYTLKKEERLSSLIQRSGGYLEDAYLRGALFNRKSAKEKQRQRLQELISRQEIDIQTTSSLLMGGTVSQEDLTSVKQALLIQKELLKKLKAAKVTGRVVIRLASLEDFIGSEYDITLEDGDELYIPRTPDTVEVLGEVYNPTSIVYRPDKTVNYYLNMVGGPTKEADEDKIYLVKADGSVISNSQREIFGIAWDKETHRWISGGFMSIKLEPGDTILVPIKLEKIHWLKTTSEFTQVLYQIAVAAGVAVAIF